MSWRMSINVYDKQKQGVCWWVQERNHDGLNLMWHCAQCNLCTLLSWAGPCCGVEACVAQWSRSRAVMTGVHTPGRFSYAREVFSESPDRSSPAVSWSPPLKSQSATETTSVRSTLAVPKWYHNNHFLFTYLTPLYPVSLPILESYDAKVEFGWLLSREISVEDELSTCMWLKLGEGNWNEDSDFVWPVWLEMNGMNMLTSIRGEADGLFLLYTHGGINEK